MVQVLVKLDSLKKLVNFFIMIWIAILLKIEGDMKKLRVLEEFSLN